MNTLSRRLKWGIPTSHPLTVRPVPQPFSPLWAHVPGAVRELWGCYHKVAESPQFRACISWQALILSSLEVLKCDIWVLATYSKPPLKSMKGNKWGQFHHKFKKLLCGSAFFSPIILTRSLGWLAVVSTSKCQRSETKSIQPRKDYSEVEESITRIPSCRSLCLLFPCI